MYSKILPGLEKEFEKSLGELNSSKVTSDEYGKGLNNLTKLKDMIVDFDRVGLENHIAIQNNQNKRDKIINYAFDGVKFLAGLGFAAWAFVASTNFEKEGTLTTTGGRTALSRLLKF